MFKCFSKKIVMPEYSVREEKKSPLIKLVLYRDKEQVGKITGQYKKLLRGEKYFEVNYFEVNPEYQKEYLKMHGMKLGESLFLEFARMLKRDNIRLIDAVSTLKQGERFLKRFNASGILEWTPRTRLVRVNLGRVPEKGREKALVRKARTYERRKKTKALYERIKKKLRRRF